MLIKSKGKSSTLGYKTKHLTAGQRLESLYERNKGESGNSEMDDLQEKEANHLYKQLKEDPGEK